MNRKTVTRTVYGETNAKAFAAHMISLSAPFTMEPLPADAWEFTVPQEHEHRLPLDERPNADDATQFYRDILCTAIEGGSNHWAQFRNVLRVPGEFGPEYDRFDIRPDRSEGLPFNDGDPRNGWQAITADKLQAAIEKSLAGEIKIRQDLVETIREAQVELDASNIDAELADCIVQAAAFGEIVFG